MGQNKRIFSSTVVSFIKDFMVHCRRRTCYVKTLDLKMVTLWRLLIVFKISCFYIARASSLYAINRDEVALSRYTGVVCAL